MKVTQYVVAVHTVFFSFFFLLTFYGHCVVCQFHVSTGCLCRAFWSLRPVRSLPAPVTRWVSDCVAGA